MEKEQAETEVKRRRTQAKYDKEATRYECFCTKQYLSYPALYLHLKNKHQNYFMRTKGGKKIENNNKLVETVDSQEGYKVLKIPISQTTPQEFSPQEARSHPPYDPFYYHNYLCMPPFFSQTSGKVPPKYLPIETAFSAFLDSLFKTEESQVPRNIKTKTET